MPVPLGTTPTLAAYLEELETRLAAVENPQAPVLVPAYATADMPTAANHIGGVIRNTTLNVLAHSDGSNWIRSDTGAAI